MLMIRLLVSTLCLFILAATTTTASYAALEDFTVTESKFSMFNQAIFGKSTAQLDAEGLTTPRGIISRLIPYLFTFAGLILFAMILWGGFEMLTGATNTKAQQDGVHRITAAMLGFFILFCSYWLAQLVELVFGISIL